MKIYCDLDGVAADFEAGYRRINNGVIPDRENKCDESFYKPVMADRHFWRDLPLMPDAKRLIDFLMSLENVEVEILTSPSKLDWKRAEAGKRIWVDKHFSPETVIHFRRGRDKPEFAHSRSILIDDWEKNTSRWNDAGGIGVRHENAEKTIDIVRTILR
jgi:hypothetical protein